MKPHTQQPPDKYQKNIITSLISTSLIFISSNSLATNLENITYSNEVQTKMSNAINDICPALAGLNGQGQLSGNEQQLFFRCREMVQTANEILEPNGNGNANSLGLTETELGDAMGQLADEEVGVQGDWATRTSNEQLNNIQSRFTQIHSGASGINLSGIQFQSGEDVINLDELSTDPTGGNAGDNFGPWGLFVSGVYSTGERDATGRQTGFDVDSLGLTAGIDYRLSDSLVAGFALGYTDAEADFVNNGGSQDVEGYNMTVYGTYYINNLYIDGSLSYGDYDYDSTRRIVYASNNPNVASVDSTAQGSTEGDQINAYVSTGYTINQGAMDYTPYFQLQYLDVEVDGYSETGGSSPELNMAVGGQSIDSLQTVLGGKAAYNSSTQWGVLIPYARADWHHEFKNDARTLAFKYVFDPLNTNYTLKTDEPDKDFFTVGLGVSTVYRSGQAYFDVEAPIGLNNVNNTIFTLGARFAF